MTNKQKAAYIILKNCLDVKKNEELLILADDPLTDIAKVLFDAASKRTKNAYFTQIKSQFLQKGLSDSLAHMMQAMDVIIAVTSHSISHTKARREACRNGTRVISMPNITVPTFSRIANTNFDKMARLSRILRDILTFAKEVSVSAPNGTELYIPISQRKGYSDTGLVKKPGQFSNIPAGEASLAPDDGKTEGLLVVDSGMGIHKSDDEKLLITLKDGRAVRISGGNPARRLRSLLSPYGTQSRLVAEFGIGTNQSARLSGYSLEDEKVLGTVHVALGNNISFGGDNDVGIHLDAVVYNATVVIDGRKILEKGKLVLE